MAELLKKLSNVAHGVKDSIERSQDVREKIKLLTDTQFIQLVRKLDVDWRKNCMASIMFCTLVDVEEKLGEVVDDEQ